MSNSTTRCLGQSIEIDNLVIRVAGIRKIAVVGSGTIEGTCDNDTFYLVRLHIDNTGTATIEFGSDNFRLFTGDARVFNADTEDWLFMPTQPSDRLPGLQLYMKPLAPGTSIEGDVLFDLPQPLSDERIEIASPLSGSTVSFWLPSE